MALDDFALITRDDAKAYIGILDDDRDEAIDDLINQASEWILNAAEQEFAPTAGEESTRRIEYRGDGVIRLAPFSIRSVSEIVLDPADQAEIHDTFQLRFAAKGRRLGVYDRIVLRGRYGALGHVQGVGYVDVTGEWGWPSVPREIERCCKRLVEMWFRSEIAFSADGYEGEELRVPMGIPLDVQDLVHSYRATRVGAA